MSEAARIFDADLLRGIIQELTDELPTFKANRELDTIRRIITLVDGTVLSALPKLVKSMWSDVKGKHGIKLHTHFELLKGVPTRMDRTDGDADELDRLRRLRGCPRSWHNQPQAAELTRPKPRPELS